MSYNVIATPRFKKDIKRLVKKYPSLKTEYAELINRLEENPEEGKKISNNCYKIRLSIASKGKGKSGGARIIAYLKITEGEVYLISIYDKAEKENISDSELQKLLMQIS